MSRTQNLIALGDVTMVAPGTLYPIYGSTLYVKSFTIQASKTNTGIVTVCDALGGALLELAPGIGCTVLGDNMDNGTAGKHDVSQTQIKSTVGGDKVHVGSDQGL